MKLGQEGVIINGGHFQFSGVGVDKLGSTEYTLVTIIADRSGSVASFQNDMEKSLKSVLTACQQSPRADNLMARLITFESKHDEVFGFKFLNDINLNDIDGVLSPGGLTSLYDAAVDGIEATSTYGRKLLEQDFSVNGIVFVLTDGGDNNSSTTVNTVKQALAAAINGENLESLVSILIGVNVTNPDIATYLQNFQNDAGFTQYVELKDATPATLAKLAAFVSKSISSQSKALGSGSASVPLNF